MKVLGKYEIGDLVVSLRQVGRNRKHGDIFKILEPSNETALYYKEGFWSDSKYEWRKADEKTIEAYNMGIRNIANIPKDGFKKGLGDCKIWIGDNPKLMEKVQERLFEMGYAWGTGTTKVMNVDSMALHIRDDKRFYFLDSMEHFEFSDGKEIYPHDIDVSMVDTGEDSYTVSRDVNGMILVNGKSHPLTSPSAVEAYIKRIANWPDPYYSDQPSLTESNKDSVIYKKPRRKNKLITSKN